MYGQAKPFDDWGGWTALNGQRKVLTQMCLCTREGRRVCLLGGLEVMVWDRVWTNTGGGTDLVD